MPRNVCISWGDVKELKLTLINLYPPDPPWGLDGPDNTDRRAHHCFPHRFTSRRTLPAPCKATPATHRGTSRLPHRGIPCAVGSAYFLRPSTTVIGTGSIPVGRWCWYRRCRIADDLRQSVDNIPSGRIRRNQQSFFPVDFPCSTSGPRG